MTFLPRYDLCPACGAEPGEACFDLRSQWKLRDRPHPGRPVTVKETT